MIRSTIVSCAVIGGLLATPRAVAADSPGVVQVVALLGQGAHQPHVLREPVSRFVIRPAAADAAVVVASVLQVNAQRLLLALADEVGVGVTAAQVDEAADQAEHFAELVRPLPGHSERRDRAGTGAADAALLRRLGQPPAQRLVGEGVVMGGGRAAIIETTNALSRMPALIAIPIAAALRVLVRLVIAPAIRRQTGAEPREGRSD